MDNSTRNLSKMDENTEWNIVPFQSDEHANRTVESRPFPPPSASGKIFDQWPEHPRQIQNKVAQAPLLRTELIPDRLRVWATDIAERMQMPSEIVVTPALVALSCVVGKKIGIQPKRHDDWFIVPNLWGGLIAPHGFLKENAISEALLPLKRLRSCDTVEKVAHDAYDWVFKAKMDVLRTQIKAAAKRSDIVTIDQLKNQIEELVRDAELSKSSIRPYETGDSKRDSISKMIHDNPNGLLIIKGHLDNWLRRLSKRKHDEDREFVLGCSRNTQTQLVNARPTNGPLCVFGELNPSELERHLKRARRKKCENSLLQRFQLLICPDSYEPLPAIDRRPNYVARESVFEVFEKIDDVMHAKGDFVAAVRFSDEAQEIFDQWAYELKIRVKNSEQESPLFSAHIANHYSLMPSLALLFSILEKPENIHGWNCVSVDATNLAVRWCTFLEAHARKAYSINQSAHTVAINRLVNTIEGGGLAHGSTLKSIFRQHDTWFYARPLVLRAIDTLEEFGWLRIINSDGAKRISLHPKYQSAHALRFHTLCTVNKFEGTN